MPHASMSTTRTASASQQTYEHPSTNPDDPLGGVLDGNTGSMAPLAMPSGLEVMSLGEIPAVSSPPGSRQQQSIEGRFKSSQNAFVARLGQYADSMVSAQQGLSESKPASQGLGTGSKPNSSFTLRSSHAQVC